VRWYRRDDLDLEPSQPPVPRIERVRELVDELPAAERHIVERLFFGGDTLLQAAREAGINPKRARQLLASGLGKLRADMLEDDQMGDVLATLVGGVGVRPVPVASDLAVEGPVTGPVLRGEDREGVVAADVGVHVGR
jgi:hypothetical protein